MAKKQRFKREDSRDKMDWYWSLWFADHELQASSLAAQGLWINMLGIMHMSEIKGTLLIAGKPIDCKALAMRLGKDESEVCDLLKELKKNKVYSKLIDGTIINRRMYGEGMISKARAKAGKLGADAKWQTDGKSDMAKSQNNDTLFSPLSPHTPLSSLSCLSSSSLSSLKEGDIGGEIEKEFKDFWKAYPPDKGDKGEARKAFFKLRETEGLETIIRSYDGYMDYLKDKRLKEHFEQQPMYASTFLHKGRWKRFLTYKSKPPL